MGVLETLNILLKEAVRVVQRGAESLAIRLFTDAPGAIARALQLGAVARRLHLGQAVEAVSEAESKAEEAVEDAVEGAVSEVAAAAGPLVLVRSAKALASRRRALPIVALVAGAVGATALALRRAARPRGR